METDSSETTQLLGEIATRLESLAKQMRATRLLYADKDAIKISSAATAYDHAALIVREYMP